ncbi:MAG: hypothetical protein UY03_C0041G0003 [Parcubacteria group bacterium GW2011_GWA2_47_64]|nr:MAG: hypothetical protein UY03_C0041G0003 [Parcubacteria group bacterium GW2011_GWA2_47_64]
MAWNNIAKYLEKFFIISPPGKFYQKEIIKALNEILSINLSEDDAEYRFGIIYIKNNNQSLKNEIFLNKEKILRQINQKLKFNKIKDLRF